MFHLVLEPSLVRLASLNLQLSFQLLDAPAGLLKGLVELVIDENVVLIAVFQILRLLLKPLHVNATSLYLLVEVLHCLLKFPHVVRTALSWALKFVQINLPWH